MPLIILSGYPCSGKSQRAAQIHAHFTHKITTSADPRIQRLKVHTVTPSTLHLPRTVYRDARSEKEARATEYSAVKRLLGKDDVVIADGLNYIKGFRYQLFCEAKALLTPSCVVHVAAPAEKCREWNAARREAAAQKGVEGEGEGNADGEPYEDEILENLIFRYEEPNGMSRWDSPLFTVPYIDEAPYLDAIWDAMVGNAVKVKANQATVLKPASESDYLYELDKTTQDVVTLIQEHQKSIGAGAGGTVPVADCAVALELPSTSITVPQLQRIRRQFIALNRQHGVGKERIRELFVEYANAQFR